MALLMKLLKKRLIPSLAAVLMSALAAGVTLWWNAQLKDIIDEIGSGRALSQEAVTWTLITLLAMAASAYAKDYLAGYACEQLAHELRMGYARHLTALQVCEIERLNAGQQVSKLQNEMADISAYLSTNLFQLVDDAVRFAATLIWLLRLNAPLTIWTYLPVMGIAAYVFFSGKVISQATDLSRQAQSEMNGYADVLLTMFPVIRLYDAARMVIGGYDAQVKRWTEQAARSERVRARLMSLSALLSAIPVALLFWVGGRMVIGGTLTVGTLYIFLNLSGNVSGVMMNMPGYVAAFRQFSANMKRISSNILVDGGRVGHGN